MTTTMCEVQSVMSGCCKAQVYDPSGIDRSVCMECELSCEVIREPRPCIECGSDTGILSVFPPMVTCKDCLK